MFMRDDPSLAPTHRANGGGDPNSPSNTNNNINQMGSNRKERENNPSSSSAGSQGSNSQTAATNIVENNADISITSTNFNTNNGGPMARSNTIPARLPMARLSLGQVLRNQLEHRRREANATQGQASAEQTTDRYYTELFGQGVPPNIAGSRRPDYHGVHTATWHT